MVDRPTWLDDVRKPPPGLPDAPKERPIPPLFDDEHRPITTREGWVARRKVVRNRWRAFLGTIAVPETAPTPTVLEEDRRDGVIRQLVRYEAEPGFPTEGYLLAPVAKAEPRSRPGVVVFHSTADITIRQPAGLEGPEDKHVGLHLARRGYVAFCPRNFLWQHSEKGRIRDAVDWLARRHHGVTGMEKMLFDAIRAVDLLVRIPDVDPARVGSFGHSLGAKEVLYLSAFDERVRATVSSEGGLPISSSNWEASWYLGEAARRPGFPLDHGQVLSLTAPRAFLLVGGDSADGPGSWPYVEAAMPVWALTGAADALGYFDHHQGHTLPKVARDRSYEWLDWFLRREA